MGVLQLISYKKLNGRKQDLLAWNENLKEIYSVNYIYDNKKMDEKLGKAISFKIHSKSHFWIDSSLSSTVLEWGCQTNGQDIKPYVSEYFVQSHNSILTSQAFY